MAYGAVGQLPAYDASIAVQQQRMHRRGRGGQGGFGAGQGGLGVGAAGACNLGDCLGAGQRTFGNQAQALQAQRGQGRGQAAQSGQGRRGGGRQRSQIRIPQ
jgi:hypothetical protein